MVLLIAGLVIWTAVHLFKRVKPEARAALDEKLGAGPTRGIISLILLASIAMMVFGFRGAEFRPIYAFGTWAIVVNNLLMLVVMFLLGAGASKGLTRQWIRHPMLVATIIWSVAHLLVNGDLTSIILFGGIAAWADASIIAINVREGAWDRPTDGTIQGDRKTAVIAVVVFVVIAAIHYFAGRSPFPY